MKKYQIITLSISLCLAIGILCYPTDPLANTLPPQQQDNTYEEMLAEFGLADRMDHHGVPGISFGVIKDGKLEWAKGYGVLQEGAEEKVDTETLFSVGSISKVGTAVMILKLHEEGLLDIDQDVNQYLTSWQVPENSHIRERAVSLRHILSHTAGLTVHGFADFLPHEKLPTTPQILNGAGPAKNNPIYVNIPVGSRFRYSGGGTTVSQMVIEDQQGKRFHEAAENLLFQALSMPRSSYENPLPGEVGNIAKAHNSSGKPVALPRGYQSMPEAAASGLWTTPTDIAQMMMMLMEAYEGENDYLSQALVQDMMTPVKPSEYGLGPEIEKGPNGIRFAHGGANDSYRAKFIGSLGTKNGIIILTNGASGSNLINELLPLFEHLL